MNALKGLFTRKKPLSSAPPNVARNNFSYVNPALNTKNITYKLQQYVNTYKKGKMNNMAALAKELQNYVKQNPGAKTIINSHFNKYKGRTKSLGNISNVEANNLRNNLYEPGVLTKRTLERLKGLGIEGGGKTRRNRRNSRRANRKTRRCGCF